jgi:hypothetical protein
MCSYVLPACTAHCTGLVCHSASVLAFIRPEHGITSDGILWRLRECHLSISESQYTRTTQRLRHRMRSGGPQPGSCISQIIPYLCIITYSSHFPQLQQAPPYQLVMQGGRDIPTPPLHSPRRPVQNTICISPSRTHTVEPKRLSCKPTTQPECDCATSAYMHYTGGWVPSPMCYSHGVAFTSN